MHEKQRQLSHQKETVKDAKYEVSEEIQKLRNDIKYSEHALRISRRMEQRISEHIATEPKSEAKHDQQHRRKHLKQHDEEWPSSHE